MNFSPLFWQIQFKKNVIYILDETLLPHKLSYIKAKNYKEAFLVKKIYERHQNRLVVGWPSLRRKKLLAPIRLPMPRSSIAV